MPTATLATNPAGTATEVFDVMFRPGDGGKWKRLGRATGYREALKFVTTGGSFWFKRVELQSDEGTSLFDAEE